MEIICSLLKNTNINFHNNYPSQNQNDDTSSIISLQGEKILQKFSIFI